MNKRKVYKLNPDTKEAIGEFDSIADAERDVKIPVGRGDISKAVSKGHRCKGFYWSAEKETITHTPTAKVLSEDDLRKRHDMFYIIFNEVNSLKEGDFIEEPVLLRRLQIYGKPGAKMALDHPDIKPFKGKADSNVYYGHPERIKKLKEEGVLR